MIAPSRSAPFGRLGRFPSALLIALSLFLAAGCNSKDDSTVAATGPQPGGGDSEAQAIQDQVLGTVDFVNAFVADIEGYSQGDFAGLNESLGLSVGAPLRSTGEPVWNEAAGAWILDEEGSETEDGSSVTYDVYFSLQFLDSQGTPQYEPDETTASFAFDVDMVMDLHAEENGEVFELRFDVLMAMALSGLPDGPFALTGSGDMDMSLLWTGVGEENIDATAAMTWSADLELATVGSCPTGTVEVTADQYRVDATYDGDSSYGYKVYESGVQIDQGSDVLDCGPAS